MDRAVATVHAKVVIVLDELKDVDDQSPRARVRHHTLQLSHLVKPELAEIPIEPRTGLAPQFEGALDAARDLLDLIDRSAEHMSVAAVEGVAVECDRSRNDDGVILDLRLACVPAACS